VSYSVIDGTPNSKDVHIGYAEKKGIRFADHTLGFGDVEEHLDLEIDAETLVGVIPAAVMAASGGGGGDASSVTYTPAVVTDWDGDADPGDVDDALDQLAERVDDLENAGPSQSVVFTFGYSGTLAIGSQPVRLHSPVDCTISNVTATVNTQPTGASIIIDVNLGGTTIFTTQGNRPTIAASANDDLSSTPDVTSVSQNDVLTFDIDQVGSGTAGADLVVQVRCAT
jgi:hypothetical protein